MGRRSARRRRAVVGRLARRDHAAGIRAGARRRHRRGDAGVEHAARRCGARRSGSGAAGASGVTRAAGMPSRKGCSRSATAIPLRPAPMPRSRAAMPRSDPLALLLHAQSAQLDGDRDGAQRAFRAMAEREDTRLLGPARPVHRGAARRRSGRRRDDRGRGAEACAVIDLGVACGARISLRQGRLERRAGDPRQQSRVGPDRQGRPIGASAACC